MVTNDHAHESGLRWIKTSKRNEFHDLRASDPERNPVPADLLGSSAKHSRTDNSQLIENIPEKTMEKYPNHFLRSK